ncbi:MAG: ThuA domain-containing protein [Fimbriimonadaceae bacterium]
MARLRVAVFNEFVHEKVHAEVKAVYPDGIHAALADALERQGGMEVRVATQDMPEHGLPNQVLAETDVLVWWGHMAHRDLSDAVADAVVRRVNAGMGFVALHSAIHSKPFLRLMGTTCDVVWREAGELERVWIACPGHPMADGLAGDFFEIPREEMYGEPFNVPAPLDTVFLSWFAGGEVFRSGLTWRRGLGKVAYFRPGHETYPTYHDPVVQRVIGNAVRWAAPTGNRDGSSPNRTVPPTPLD